MHSGKGDETDWSRQIGSSQMGWTRLSASFFSFLFFFIFSFSFSSSFSLFSLPFLKSHFGRGCRAARTGKVVLETRLGGKRRPEEFRVGGETKEKSEVKQKKSSTTEPMAAGKRKYIGKRGVGAESRPLWPFMCTSYS